MHGHGIVGALWTAAVTAALAGGATLPLTARASIVYNYLGAPLANLRVIDCPIGGPPDCPNPFASHPPISGSITFPDALPSSMTSEDAAYQSFSFTDGPTTVTNTSPNVMISTLFQTDSIGQITSGYVSLDAFDPISSTSITMTITSTGDMASYFNSLSGSCCTFATASNLTPGVWYTSTPPTPLPISPDYADDLENLGLALGTLALFTESKLWEFLGLLSDGVSEIIKQFNDPADFNYTQIAVPTPPPVPSLPALSGCKAAAAPIASDFAQSAIQAIGLVDAAQVSANRATGAFLSNAPTFEALQLSTESGYVNQAQTAIANMFNDVSGLFGLLPDTCDPTITVADVSAEQQQLANSGFDASDVTFLQGLGLTSPEIEDFASSLAALDPIPEAGTYPQDFQQLIPSQVSTPEPQPLLIFGPALAMFLVIRHLLGQKKKECGQ